MTTPKEERTHPKKKPKGKPVEFDHSALKNWVTGFGKRKQQRREYGAIQLAKKQRIARNEARKERRDAMKIKDRLTGAFGEKHKDDSDDELGDLAQNPEDFEEEQKAAKLAEKAAKKAQNRHEDEEAVVTVVTRENDSDDDMSDDESDDDDEDEVDEPGGRRTGFPFRLADAPEDETAATPQAASTPYNPSKSHQVQALQKAKLALKAKDKASRKGMSAKGGHAYKKPKLTSKKKKIKLGKKKGANRDR